MGDAKEFYPIELSAIKSFRFASITDSSSSFEVASREEKCWGCCSCPWCFTTNKTWFTRTSEPRVYKADRREIVLYLDLPPWSERAILTVSVGAGIPLDTVKGFVAQLQSVIATAPVAQQPHY